MAPKVGDTVFVNEADPLTDDDVVSPGVVVHVYGPEDANGDTGWWDNVKDKGVADVFVLRRNGTTEVLTSTQGETVKDDQGRDRWQSGTYASSADGPSRQAQGQSAPSTPTNPAPATPDVNAGTVADAGVAGTQSETASGSNAPGWTDSAPAQ